MSIAIDNPLLRRLKAGELAIGIGVRIFRTVEVARAMLGAGYDWLFIDLEHGTLPLDTAMQISVAALGAGIAPLVRVPAGDFATATRALDGGAQGIVVPHVDTPEQAREVVARLKYPPLGHRSVGGNGAVLGFRPDLLAQSTQALNEATLTVVMLETPAAIANADAIAAVPGIDLLLVGTNDLCTEMGIPGAFGDARVTEAYERVLAACARHHKWPGMAGVSDMAVLCRQIRAGIRFVLAGSDFPILMAAAARRSAELRQAADPKGTGK